MSVASEAKQKKKERGRPLLARSPQQNTYTEGNKEEYLHGISEGTLSERGRKGMVFIPTWSGAGAKAVETHEVESCWMKVHLLSPQWGLTPEEYP